MNLLEHQGKLLLAEAEVPVPMGIVAKSPLEVLQAAEALGGECILKAQVPVGGRGKAGGIRSISSPDEATKAAEEIFALEIRNFRPTSILVESRVHMAAEYYMAIILERGTRAPMLMFSAAGGMDIEELAAERPGELIFESIDPLSGLLPFQVRAVLTKCGLSAYANELVPVVMKAYDLFVLRECSLVEINPLVRLVEGAVQALDAKIIVDDNSLFRQPDIALYASEAGKSATEVEAEKIGVHYVDLEGDIGIIGNGAGLVMATLDLVAAAGGRPANFLDVGGGAKARQVAGSLRILFADSTVRVVLVNIFGGITRCEEVALGLREVMDESGGTLAKPVVVRLDGTGAEEAKRMLRGAPITSADTFEAAAAAVAKMSLAADGGELG